MTLPMEPSRAQRLAIAFQREEIRAMRLMYRAAVAFFVCVVPWITLENGFPAAFFFYGIMAAMLLALWWTRSLLERIPERRWPWYVFIASASLLCTAAFTVDNPLQSTDLPVAFRLGLGNQAYLFVIIVLSGFSFSPRVVVWAGLSCAGAWTAATCYALGDANTLPPLTNADVFGLTPEQFAHAVGDIRRLDVGESIRHILAMLGVTVVVAQSVKQSRRLVSAQVESEDRRGNLARYFSPNLVEQLAEGGSDILIPSDHEATVVFIDLVGFTRLVESWPPDAVLDLLREYHGIVAPIVFEHGGTIDKYIGDGIMCTFGTIAARPDDAADAMRCCRAILAAADRWNSRRTEAGLCHIDLSIGLHAGPVVSGNVGGSNRLEYTVIGDAVNVASRLERLTRSLGTRLLASDAVFGRLADERQSADMVKLVAQHLPGRQAPINVWALSASHTEDRTLRTFRDRCRSGTVRKSHSCLPSASLSRTMNKTI